MTPRELETKYLTAVQLYTSAVLPPARLLEQIGGIDWFCEHQLPMMMDNLVVSIQGILAAENITNITVEYPRNWWEAVKQRFGPAWFITRYPVKQVVTTIDIKAIWAGFHPSPGSEKYGPFYPYVLQRTFGQVEED